MHGRPVGQSTEPRCSPQKLHVVHRHGSQWEREFCTIRRPKSDPSCNQMAENAPDYVKDLNCAIRQLEFYQNPDPMVDIRSDFDKN